LNRTYFSGLVSTVARCGATRSAGVRSAEVRSAGVRSPVVIDPVVPVPVIPYRAALKLVNRCFLLLCALLLVGCQNLRQPAGSGITEREIAARETRLAAFTTWRALGGLSIDSEKRGVINASFSWNVDIDRFSIKLFGPLGLQQYEVSEDAFGAELIADGDKLRGFTAEDLLRQALGVNIPLTQMQSWIVGLPDDATQVERDRIGRLGNIVHIDDLEDTEWEIEFVRYRKFDELDLPRTIVVNGDDIVIRLSIRKWLKPDTVNSERLVIPGQGS